MLTDDQAPTCSLVEFLEAWNEEPNLVWRVRTGHLIHLLEAAVARIEALETLLSEMEGSDEDTELAGRSAFADRPTTSLVAGPEAVTWPRKAPGSARLDPRQTKGSGDMTALAPTMPGHRAKPALELPGVP